MTDDKKSLLFKIISGSLALLSWIIFFVIRNDPEKSLVVPIIISALLTLMFFVSLFKNKIFGMIELGKQSNEIPEPISREELKEIMRREVRGMWNYIEEGTRARVEPHNINSNIIYGIELTLYSEEDFGGVKSDKIIMIINATYPNKIAPAILPPNTPKQEILNAINRASLNPYPDPDIERIETRLDQFKNPIEVRVKKTHKERIENKEKEESVV